MANRIDSPLVTSKCYHFLYTVPGDWSEWGGWTNCPVSCGGGQVQRNRTCTSPEPRFGGPTCFGFGMDQQVCNTEDCLGEELRTLQQVLMIYMLITFSLLFKVDGAWSPWSPWSTQCSRSCGNGTVERMRSCDSPMPGNGGQMCPGNSTEEQGCYVTPCRGSLFFFALFSFIKFDQFNCCLFAVVMTASKGLPGEPVVVRFNSLAGANSACAVPSQIENQDLKTTRCELLNGLPVCCGGASLSSSSNYYNTCWRYSYATNTWTEMGSNLTQLKFRGYAVELKDGRLWYTGIYTMF